MVWKGFPSFPAHLRMRPVSRGNSRSSSCLGRKPPRAPQLEETPETPPSSLGVTLEGNRRVREFWGMHERSQVPFRTSGRNMGLPWRRYRWQGQTHVHRVSDTLQPSHPLSSPSPPAPNPSHKAEESTLLWRSGAVQTGALQAPLCMGFLWQAYWSRLPFPPSRRPS